MNSVPNRDTRWLQRLSKRTGAMVANRARTAFERGATSPSALLSTIAESLRIQASDPYYGDALTEIEDAYREVPDEAMGWANWFLYYIKLPKREQERQKMDRARPFIQRGREEEPITDKQRQCLLKLGVTVIPQYKWEASQTLSELLKRTP